MHSQVTFRSTAFLATPCDTAYAPHTYGKRLAEYLAARLPQQGFPVRAALGEDWGWRIDLGHRSFPISIGCANCPADNGADGTFLCFIKPDQPHIRRLMRRIDTRADIARLVQAVDNILRSDSRIRDIRWTDA